MRGVNKVKRFEKAEVRHRMWRNLKVLKITWKDQNVRGGGGKRQFHLRGRKTPFYMLQTITG